MTLTGNFRFLGAEELKTKEGKAYYIVALLQGMDSEKMYVSESQYREYCSIPEFSEVECELKVTINGNRTFLNCESIRQISKK